MRFREFPVLSEEDEELREALETGLGTEAAEVLAYLLRRSESPDVTPDAATRLEIRIGTGLGRDATIRATNDLESAGAIEVTSVGIQETEHNRKAWFPAKDRESTLSAVRQFHASTLIDRSREIVATFDPSAISADGSPTEGVTGTLSLGLNWEPNEVHVQVLMASENGWYDDRDIVVRLHPQHGSGQAIKSLREKQTDVCIAGPATVMRTLNGGEAIFPIALLYQRSTVVLYTIRDQFGEPFETVEQLRGKAVAMIPESETGIIARLFLSQADILDQVDVIEMDNEERSQLLSGTVDVAAGMITDPILLEESGYQVDSILIGRHFPIPGLAIATRAGIVENRHDDLVEFLAGTMRGWHAARRNPKRTAERLETVLDEPHTAVIEHLMEEFGVTNATHEHGWGWQSTDQWTRLHSAMEQAGMLAGSI